MSIENKLIEIAENVPKVYEAGYAKGKEEGVGGIDYDNFWDRFQNNGADEGISYLYAFAYNRFNDDSYNPKHPIICMTGSTTAERMFYNNTKITSTKKPIDVTKATSLNYAFGCYSAGENSRLETIVELIVNEKNTYISTFTLASALKNINITGTIGETISLEYSPLTKQSIYSVVNALSDTATGKTCTFKKTAVTAAFGNSTSSAEWVALKETKPNWTFTVK